MGPSERPVDGSAGDAHGLLQHWLHRIMAAESGAMQVYTLDGLHHFTCMFTVGSLSNDTFNAAVCSSSHASGMTTGASVRVRSTHGPSSQNPDPRKKSAGQLSNLLNLVSDKLCSK